MTDPFKNLPDSSVSVLRDKLNRDLNACISDLINIDSDREIVQLQGKAQYIKYLLGQLDTKNRS